MLELLARYARDHALTLEPGFAPKAVKWVIRCSSDGNLQGVLQLGDPGAKKNPGHVFPQSPELSQPEIKRGGQGCRHFLVDTTDVVVLLSDPEDPKLRAKHAYFVGLLRQASTAMPELRAAALCLENSAQVEKIRQELLAQKAKATENVTFALAGLTPSEYAVEHDTWHDWWRDFRQALAGGKKPAKGTAAGATTMRCLVSGKLVEPALTHPKIRGLVDVGGFSGGDVLASFKQDAFRSYGLVQSENAAVSEAMAAQYRAGLNELLASTGQRLVGAKVVHWFKIQVPAEDDPLPWLGANQDTAEVAAQEHARQLLQALEKGERPDLKNNHYYALILSGAAGRVMVRDWMEGAFEDLLNAVVAWFDDLEIVRRDGEGRAPAPKFFAVLGALVRDLDDVAPPAASRLWRIAVRRDEIPVQFLAQAHARVRIDVVQDKPFNHARMGLLKAFHIRKGDANMKPELNEEHSSPAYQCGRLLAVLAAVQYRALGDVGAGVVQRYYASACATPALVLGRLIRNSQFHLDKLEPGLRRFFENKIAAIVAAIKNELPQVLELSEQSLFALGYYQQIASDRARRTTTPDSENLPEPSSEESVHV